VSLKRIGKRVRKAAKRVGRKAAPGVAKVAPYKTAVLAGVATYLATPAAGAAVTAIGGEASRYWGATAARADGYSGRHARDKGRNVRKKAWIGGGVGVVAGTATAVLAGSPWTGKGLLSSAASKGVGSSSANAKAQAGASSSTKLTTSQALADAGRQMTAAGKLTGNPTLLGAGASATAGAQMVPGTGLTVAEVLTAGGTLSGIAKAFGVDPSGTSPSSMPNPDGGERAGGGDGGAGYSPFGSINAPGAEGEGRPLPIGLLLGGLALLAIAT